MSILWLVPVLVLAGGVIALAVASRGLARAMHEWQAEVTRLARLGDEVAALRRR